MPGELSDLLKLWDRSDVLDTIASEGEAGLPDAARPATVAGLAERVSPLLVVLPRSRDAEAFAGALGRAAVACERASRGGRAGEFWGRGGPPDVPPRGAEPVRADFFGDEITSLKTFSIGSQRSLADAAGVDILAARELLLGPPAM